MAAVSLFVSRSLPSNRSICLKMVYEILYEQSDLLLSRRCRRNICSFQSVAIDLTQRIDLHDIHGFSAYV
jgi:hypothetical protein